MIKSSIPGRTDKIPLSVKSGAFIVPADIPSALGQGNSEAGADILSKMFGVMPYSGGKSLPMRGGRLNAPRLRPPPRRIPRAPTMEFEDGGDVEDTGADEVPIMAAGGEWVVDPETVRQIGGGSIDVGSKILHRFVLMARKEHIRQLKALREPKE